MEGKKQVSHHVSSLHIADLNDPSIRQIKDFRALEAFRAIRIQNSRDIRIENVSFSQQFDEPDCFIYCLSSKNSSHMYREFEGSDSCVEIVNPTAFFKQVSVSLNAITPVTFRGIHPVTYASKEEQWNGADWGTPPAYLKEPEFRPQAELRAIWTPDFEKAIEPVIIGNSQIIATCKRITPRHELRKP
jgi:hypothetical protein